MNQYVTLPSRTPGIFKDNLTSDFTVLLPKALKFNNPTKVGLSEIIFSSQWLVDMGEFKITHVKTQKLFIIPITIEDGSTFKQLISFINKSISIFYLQEEIEKRIEIRKELPPEIANSNNDIQLIDKNNVQTLPTPNKSPTSQVVSEIQLLFNIPQIIIDSDNRVSFAKFKDYEFSVTDRLIDYFGDQTITADSSDLLFKTVIFNNTKVEVNKVLYVYTNIVQYSALGDKLVPILRCIPVQRINEGTVSIVYDVPDYLNLSKSEIDRIHINICDDSGKNIKFINNSNVIIKLNFRTEEFGF